MKFDPPFGRRRETELLRGHDHPLANLAVADHVLLDRLRVVVVRIAPQDVARFVKAADVVGREDARPGRVEARADQLTGVHQVLIRQRILRRRLRIPLRRHAEGELGEELRHLAAMDAPRHPRVRVDVDQPRHDRLARQIADDRTRGDLHLAARTDRRDAVVGDHDVAARDHLIAFHRDQPRVAQRDDPLRLVLVDDDLDVHPVRLVLERRDLRRRRRLLRRGLLGRGLVGRGLSVGGRRRLPGRRRGSGTLGFGLGLDAVRQVHLRLRGDVVQEEAAADREVRRLAVGGPADEVAADLRQPPRRHGR